MDNYHWQHFSQFSRLELGTGGPDPHLKLAVYGMNQTEDLYEKAWRAGCYVGMYEISTGAVIWNNWPQEKVLTVPEEFTNWIGQNWQGFQIRRERRAARTKTKMAEALISYAEWVNNELPDIQESPYEDVWKSADKNLRYYGRYALIKVLETLHRGGLLRYPIPDIRPAGAWSPRKTLGWLYPEHTELMNTGGNKPVVLGQINNIVEYLRQDLSQEISFEVSAFQLEVLLCNYRQALESKYPGRPHDTDLKYHYKVREYWGDSIEDEFDFFGARKELFPQNVLGELKGWDGVREELGYCHSKHGYFWCDTLFDYNKTTDLSVPVTI